MLCSLDQTPANLPPSEVVFFQLIDLRYKNYRFTKNKAFVKCLSVTCIRTLNQPPSPHTIQPQLALFDPDKIHLTKCVRCPISLKNFHLVPCLHTECSQFWSVTDATWQQRSIHEAIIF